MRGSRLALGASPSESKRRRRTTRAKRNVLVVYSIMVCLLACAFAASASAQYTPNAVTESSNGWFYYHDSAIKGQLVRSEKQEKITGTHMHGGGCKFSGQEMLRNDVTEMIEEETAYNPATCEAVIVRAVLGETSGSGSSAPSAGTAVQPAGSTTVRFRSGHIRSIWRDPVGINITSLIDDLSWPLYEVAGPVKTHVYSYEFKWDKWSNSGQQGPYLTKSEGYYSKASIEPKGAELGHDWYSSAHETFYNSDFAKLLDNIGIGIIACEEKNVETEFYHNIKVFGYTSNAVGAWWEYKKKGACSNLVHTVTYWGWGWDGPEKEDLEWPAIIASHENESEGEASEAGGITEPTVETIGATKVSSRKATLNGEVSPEGTETHYHYEYGTSESYGKYTSELSAGFGKTMVHASATVSGLKPSTTYHYRLVASNAAGTSYGPDQVFQTSPITTGNALVAKSGELLVFAADTSHELISFSRNNEGAWSVFNVTAFVSGTPLVVGMPVVREPAPGELLVFTADTNHELISFSRSREGAWSVFNITSVVSGTPTIVGTPTVLEPKLGEYAVLAADTNHELVEFDRTTAGAWSVFNITAVVSGNPTIVSAPAVKEPKPGEYLVFAEDTNHEFIAFARTTAGAWSVFNVTAVVSGTPDILNTPAVLEPKPGEYHAFVPDSNNEMVDFVRTSAGAWSVFNVTSVVAGTPDVLAETPAVVEPAPGEFIVFSADTSHELISFSRTTEGGWSVYNVTAAVAGTPDVE